MVMTLVSKFTRVHFNPMISPPAAAGVDEQVGDGFPFDGRFFQGIQDFIHFLRLVIIRRRSLRFGRSCLLSRVVGNEQFLLSLCQDTGNQAMVLNNGFGGQRCCIILEGNGSLPWASTPD